MNESSAPRPMSPPPRRERLVRHLGSHRGTDIALRVVLFAVALAAVAVFVAGIVVFAGKVPAASGGTPDCPRHGLTWLTCAGLAGAPQGDPTTAAALRAGWWLIGLCGAGLVAGAALTWLLAGGAPMRRWGRVGTVCALLTVAALCTASGQARHHRMVASAAAVLGYSVLVPAFALATCGVLLAVVRFIDLRGGTTVPADQVQPPRLITDDQLMQSTGTEGTRTQHADTKVDAASERWRAAYDVPPCKHPFHGQAVRKPSGIGIGLSGGGIRAATTAMGVLQSAAFRTKVLANADHLVSVSGGGYTAGAFVQTLTPAKDQDIRGIEREPATAFAVGSPEEDHLRRHSSYIADNPAQLLTGYGVVASHFVLTIVLVFGPAIVLGVLTGIAYRYVPVTTLHRSGYPGFRGGAWVSLGSLVALAVGAWLAKNWLLAHRRDSHRRASAVAAVLGHLAALVGVFVTVIPLVEYAAAYVLNKTPVGVHVGAPILAVLYTYGVAVTSFARKRLKKGKSGSKSAIPASAPSGVVQVSLVILALAVLGISWLLLFGSMITVGLDPGIDAATVSAVAVLAALLIFLGGVTDETTLSLHTFYRARIARTFAVRRVVRGGQAVAVPYAPAEHTKLADYGRTVAGFPHVVFAASATLGREHAPPGDNRVSYTFCADWVGGPDVGYVGTEALYDVSPPRLQRDLTVQGAVALSGAAIAASLGGQGSRWYEELFVLSGARLGAWMPNPRYVAGHYTRRRTALEAELPRARRLGYLLRELFGAHPPLGRLLQVTDGGFYDNLGLIELLRRKCTTIYIVDASGDSPPAASTLAHAISLAYQELGVEISLPSGTWKTATAGGAAALDPKGPLEALSMRLSQNGIITGDITYPPCAGVTGPARLVVAKSSLWTDLPYELLAFAQDNAVFPHASTADQFFDDGQYTAYTALGRLLGDAAASA